MLLVLLSAAFQASAKGKEKDKVVVAYVTSWTDVIPDPDVVTNVNYAFGHVKDSFDGVRIDNADRLREIAELGSKHKDMKVSLSVGGWGSGNFSEMAASDSLRNAFADDCRRIVDDYGLAGIDIDWEYPGSDAAGISRSDNDRENFTLLMRDLRKALGIKKLLTIAVSAGGEFIDYVDILPYVDFINVMTYDMASVPKHHAALFNSENTPSMTCDAAIKAHIEKGVPADRLVMGIPFYGRGAEGYGFVNFKDVEVPEGCVEIFDEKAMVPYMMDESGNLMLGFDNERSVGAKCDYINGHGLKGAMYWDYSGDRPDGTLSKLISKKILGRK